LNAKLSDIALATSAAPTLLPSHQFKNYGFQFDLIDGGLATNNPVNIHQKLKFREIYIYIFVLVFL